MACVLVTGANRGIGLEFARQYAEAGDRVIACCRNPDTADDLQALRDAHAGAITVEPLDLLDFGSIDALAERLDNSPIDILINNAGIPAPRAFEDTDISDWDEVIGVNLSGVFYLTRALWSSLCAADSAYVINISGTAGLRGGGSPAYGGSKFGLTGLNHAIAQAGVAHNIRATILYPGGMDTGWRGAPIGVLPRSETMDPQAVARMIVQLLLTPAEFVVNEAVLNPLAYPFM